MSGNSRERRRQARALRHQQQSHHPEPPPAPDPVVESALEGVQPPLSRSPPLQDGVVPVLPPVPARMSARTSASPDGLAAPRGFVDGSVSAEQAPVLPAVLDDAVVCVGTTSHSLTGTPVLEESFISAQEMVSGSTWRTQRWEHHRRQRCVRLGLPQGPAVSFTERLDNMPLDTRTLPYGLCRTSIGTWITTMEGQTAFYPRRAREYEEWDLDSENNIRSPFPRHPSFDNTVDEDDYFIDYVSCTSNFSFTAHPEDYEGCRIIPPTSISIRRHASSLEDDVRAAWQSDSGNDGDADLPGSDLHLRQRNAMVALALTMDDVHLHLLDLFDRNRDLGARIVGARDEAESALLQVSEYVTHSGNDLKAAVRDELESLRQGIDVEIADVADDFHVQVSALEKRISALERRMDVLPSTSPIPPLQAIRGSLNALERAATTRLTDHASALMASLARRRASCTNNDTRGRSSGTSGWSVASDSQLSVDAPADHGGDSPPVTIRGGGNTSSPRDPISPLGRDHNPGLSRSSVPQDGLGTVGAADTAGVVPTNVDPSATRVQVRNPTPWVNGNIFSARENAANDARLLAPAPPTQEVPVIPETDSSPSEVMVHGQRYRKVPSDHDPVMQFLAPPPGLEPSSPLLLASAQRVSSPGKRWHGGGHARSFMTGVEYLSPDQVAALGVPSSMAFVVVSAHQQIYSHWGRVMDCGSHPQRGYQGELRASPGRMFGPNHHEAIKYSGWPELPREGVTPERWIEFYTALQLMGTYFNIGIMPFEALDLNYSDGGHALCICGLGYSIFTKMGSSLFLIVQKLLPLTVPEISTKVQSVALNGGNGFELLWVLTKHYVPMVSTTKHLGWPQWPSTDDPFLFARRVSLFCTLCRLRGMKAYTDSERSDLFLSNVGGAHREYAQHLLTTLHVHASSSVDGSLPSHLKLQIPDLTERLMDRLRDDSRGAIAPILNRLVVPPASPSPDSSSVPPVDHPHIQGYCVNIARVNKSTPRGTPVPKITAARRGTSSVRRPRFEGNCDACGKWGHQVVDCDALGMAVCLRKYLPNRSNSRAMQECEENWTEKNKKWVSTDVPPRKLLTRYCESVGLSLDQVDEELDWDLLYSSPDDQLADVDSSTLQCNRVEEPSADSTDWFNLAPSSSAWFPQSFRVGLSPLVPPGSTLDTMPISTEDMVGEIVDPALRSVDDDDESLVSDDDESAELIHPILPPITSYALLASLATDIRPVDILRAFETIPVGNEVAPLPMAVDPCGWSDVLAEELSRVRESFRLASLDAPDICHSLAVPEFIPILPSSSRCSRQPGHLLVDSGSNVCLTNDLSILVNVQDMTPRALDVAVDSATSPPSLETMCTKFGFLPIQLLDGSVHRQRFLYNESASDTILSPEDIVRSSPLLRYWVQSGSGGPGGDGCLLFSGRDETTVRLSLALVKRNGLYYCCLPHLTAPDTEVVGGPRRDPDPTPASDRDLVTTPLLVNTVSHPVTARDHLTSELWAARLGYCGTQQLSLIPGNVTGVPPKFRCHPFRFIDVKEDAAIKKKPSGTATSIAAKNGSVFMMDFSFLRASSSDYGATPPLSSEDRIVHSFDGFCSCLLIVDKRSRRSWVFLRKSKEPPTELVNIFLKKYGLPEGGRIRCDQGGELARSDAFRLMALSPHGYVVEPTGADSPSQNGGVERWNGTLAVTVRALLYGAGLPAQYWSAAITHASYLHNRRVHMVTCRTPYEMWHGKKPDLRHLRVFGSRVCVKKSGDRPAKLDNHAFHGIFIGYTATDKNIRYIDLNSGLVKSCHHAVFDEAWYTQDKRPPTAQMLYTLGAGKNDIVSPEEELPSLNNGNGLPPSPPIVSNLPDDRGPLSSSRVNADAKVVHEFDITHRDLQMVYFSPSPYNAAFEESINKKWLTRPLMQRHPSGGMTFLVSNDRLLLDSIQESTPFAMLPRWRSRLRGAWLINVDGQPISCLKDVEDALQASLGKPGSSCTLLFSHPEIKHGLTSDGIPQISVDMMNPGHHLGVSLPGDMQPEAIKTGSFRIVDNGGVQSCISNATRLTRGRLLKQSDWKDWSEAEKLQWDQYEAQGMLGTPCPLPAGSSRFNIVWQYDIKQDGRKKARATCDGSTRGNVVRVLDHTYAGTPDHISQRIFFAACAAENLLVYGSDASNAFAEAHPPKQGINLHADRSFREWWVWKGRPPLPDGYVIPLLSAMQGHPEAPRLWEKHIDKILRQIGLIPTVHEPCLYSGLVDGHRVLLLRQVDDFATAAADASTCEAVLDLIDHHLKIPLKRLGLVTMYNGVNVEQTKHYIKLSCESYIDKISARHLDKWMRAFTVPPLNPTPLPTTSGFAKSFLSAAGNEHDQKDLEHRMKMSYRSGVGELIYALVTCRPDISHAVVRCAQNCVHPHEVHYHAVKHVLKYLYLTKSDGIYFWRETPNVNLVEKLPPVLSSTAHDLMMDGRPQHASTSLHGYVDSDWATCPKTRRSMTGACIGLAGGTIAYKTKLQATVAQSSTEAEFMGACDFGKMMLYIRSILWDLGIPQHSASFLYEDNDACTAMAMAQKPTPRTRHMDIKFYALCEWVERDLIRLERIDTTINPADHFTKILSPILFRRHTDYIMGKVPPHYSVCHPVFRQSNAMKDLSLHGPVTPAVRQLVSTWETIADLSSN